MQVEWLWKDVDSRTGDCPAIGRTEGGYVVVGKRLDAGAVDSSPYGIGEDEVATFVPANVLDRLRDQ